VQARTWLDALLDGPVRVGFPWQTLTAFQRVISHARLFDSALSPEEAWQQVTAWLASPGAWIPLPGLRYRDIFGNLIQQYHPRGDLVTDVALAALVVEQRALLYSADNDFARFREVRWENPLGG
jgi:uncharacterized protein